MRNLLLLPVTFVFAITCFLQFSCNEISSPRDVDNLLNDLNIFINGAYSCYDEIDLRSSGSGQYIYGFGRTDDKYTIKGKKLFSINHDSIKLKINETIKRIKVRPPVISQEGMNDGFHFTLVIDNTKLINMGMIVYLLKSSLS
jgi:hypothetical protein